MSGTILHLLPHPGGGGETLVDLASQLSGWRHEREYLSASRSPLAAAPSLASGLVRAARSSRQADLLHVVGDTGALLSLPLLHTRPSVFDPQGLHLLRRSHGPRAKAVRRGLRAVVAASRLTVCSSRPEYDDLTALAGAGLADRLVEVPNGISLPPAPDPERRAATRAELGLSDEQVAGLYLGQLEPRKRVLDAVRAAEAAAGRSTFVLLVAGDGPDAEAVARHAGPAVRPLGFRPDADRLLEAADVFVMPSEREGLSLAVMEALANGLATVVSDGPGNPEAVGEAGVVVALGDVHGLGEAFARLALDPAERQRLGAGARRRAEKRFSAERYLSDLEAVFRAAVA